MRVFADLAVGTETGMLRFEFGGILKDVYLTRGAPESITSNQTVDRFGDYLVARGFVRAPDLETALNQVARTGGKLGDALVAMGLMRTLDAFRLLSQHVRERVMELYGWIQGNFAFYRGMRNQGEAFPLGLDSFEIVGASVLTLSFDFLQARFSLLQDFNPRAMPQPRIALEAFKLGALPREIWSTLDGQRSVREHVARFASGGDLLTFLRILYLLVETDLARLE
jgi:eukaryotic-like serine/threonine-protein kinase